MTVQLILVRHGSAENLKPEGKDEDRQLTESGKSELIARMADLRELINPNQEIHLWSSILLRAVETADILAQGLGLSKIVHFDFINRGDLVDLTNEIATLKSPCAVIAIGHEPSLGDWSKSICGYRIPFDKGLAASIRLSALSPLTGEMEWLLPLKKPVLNRRKPLKSEYQKLLVFYFSDVSKAKYEFLKTPEDPETAHQFRIKIRQMRSLISFIKPLMDEEKYQLIQSRLRSLTNRFGGLRELDAIMEEWLLLTEKHADCPDVCTALREVIEKERRGQVAELRKLYMTEQPFNKLEDIWGLIIEASWEFDEKTNRLYGEYIDGRINKLLKKTEKDFKSIDLKDIEKTHKLRINIKKLRYNLAILEPKIKRKTQIMNNLKMLQYKLGLICDAHRDELILSELRTRYDEKTFHYESGLLAGYLIAKSDRIEEELENFHRI